VSEVSIDRDDYVLEQTDAPIDLASYDTKSKCGFEGKNDSTHHLESDVRELERLQDMFAAQTRYALLIVLQGMDAAGKDGIIKHVMSGINPQGVNVYSFRQPSTEEVRHDYLWRQERVLPERGRFAIFNRSHYEELLIVRVHPELLEQQGYVTVPPDIWEQRYEDINAFERHLTRCGTTVVKIFLHLSKDEQRKRLLKRLETPARMWKASDADLVTHAEWDKYAGAYAAMLGRTSTPWAPWHIVPADRKWAARAVVGRILVETLRGLDLTYPDIGDARRAEYARLAEQLKAEST
jgi:PPK2 family polyphosphate:nucleotide phosphotransferase